MCAEVLIMREIACPAPVDGALVGANQLFLLLQEPDGCFKWEHSAAAAAWGCNHFHTLLQCLRPLVLPQSRPTAQLDKVWTTFLSTAPMLTA